MKNKTQLSLILCLSLIFLVSTVSAYCSDSPTSPIYTVGSATASPSEVSLGGSASITVPITSGAENTPYSCTMTIGSQSTSKSVQPGRTEELTMSVNAPSSDFTSQKTETVNINIVCTGIWDRLWPLCDYEVYGQVSRSASYRWPTSAEVAEKQAKTQSDSAKNGATNAISGANTAINSAQSRVNEASKIGADISSATQYINSAQSDYSSANTLLSSGNSAYSSKDYSSASSYYQQAQSKATSAQTSASSAKSMVDKIIETYNQAKTDAQNKVSDSNSAIDTANKRIQDADGIISNATILGLDTAQSKADVATARSKMDTANSYYKEASNLFSTGNFEGAKSKSQSAIDLSKEAEVLATTAYNRLNERLTVAGESSKAILNANSEVSQMNEILTKMDYIIISTEKWGVDLTDTKAVVTEAKTNVDASEDLLSQAKNRQASGSFTEAVNFANEARDKSASSRNRLDTMTQTMSISTQSALDKAYTQLKSQVAIAEAEITSAQGTYGATANLIVDAQTDLTEAKNNLAQVESHISSVKSSSDLMSLLKEADTAFKIIDTAKEKLESSLANSKSAKLGLAKKVGIGVAVVGGLAGGGFLYYRMKKKKKGTAEKKEEKHEAKKESKTKPHHKKK